MLSSHLERLSPRKKVRLRRLSPAASPLGGVPPPPRTVYFVKILEKFLEASVAARDFVLVFDFIENTVLEFQDGQCQICFGNQNT